MDSKMQVIVGIALLLCAHVLDAYDETDCYMKACQISIDTRDNTNTIMESLGSSGSSMNETVLQSEEAMKSHAMVELQQLEQQFTLDMEGGAGVVSQAIDGAKADILADIGMVCPNNEFKLADITSLDIELDVYSGVPNPTWTVESSAAVFNSLVAMLVKAKSTPFSLIAGYRGFIVQVRISGGAVVTYRFRAGQQMSLETALLNSNIALDIPLVSVVTTGIKGQQAPDLGFTAPLSYFALDGFDSECGRSKACTDPIFDPSAWTGLSELTNNCYNYAFNYPTNTLAQPGRKAAMMYTSVTGNDVRDATVQDKFSDFNDTTSSVFPDSNNCLTALMIMENLDFHFLRQDSGGAWSHKLGANTPINVDNDGNAIMDPRTANLGPYQFVRFLGYCEKLIRKHGME